MNISKTIWRLLSICLIIALVFTTTPVTFTAASTAEFAGGNGTQEAPYLIETKEHLNNVRSHLDAHYKLTENITFEETDKRWEPIDAFTGVFDGNGHVIENLYVRVCDVSEVKVGFFADNEGTIKNLSLSNAKIEAFGEFTSFFRSVKIYAGTIAGYSSGNISNCYSSGLVYVETLYNGTPSSQYKNDIYAGGIVGYVGFSGIVENCYNNSSVTTKPHTVQPNPCAGGIAGGSTGLISCSYSTGNIDSSHDTHGGIVGVQSTVGSSTNCYYLENVSKGVGSGTDNCTKCTSISMTQKNTFVGFDFTNVWEFDDSLGYCYPVLQNAYVPIVKKLDHIVVTTLPNKTSYLEGKEKLNISGGKLTPYYDNSTSKVIDLEESMVSGFDNTVVGNQELTVTYEDKSTNFSVTISPKKAISLSILRLPFKYTYVEGESFDPNGLLVEATYNNNTTELITNYTLSGYSPTPGEKSIIISYEEIIETFSVLVEEKELISIAITSLPTKRQYYEGDVFDPTGLEVTARYNNQTSTVINDYNIVVDTSNPEWIDVTISYGDKRAGFSLHIEKIEVVSISTTKLPKKDVYYEGESLDITGLEITAHYNNLTSKVVDDYTISGYLPTLGTQTVTVSYNGQSTVFYVIVVKNEFRGDVDGDGTINSTDARLVLQYAVKKIDSTALNVTVADVNDDGIVNSTDARLILQYAVKKIDSF